MKDAASSVYNAATRGGMSITPDVLSVAIRAAVMECRDARGQLSLSKLYELTCDIENITP